jgi:hypothetical protein
MADRVEARCVALADAEWALFNGELDDVLSHARRASEIARRFTRRDLDVLGVATQGRVLIARGDARDGLGSESAPKCAATVHRTR